MRVARFKEASGKSSTRTGARVEAPALPEVALHPLTMSLTTKEGAIESAPAGGFMYQSEEEIEDNGLNFTAEYKKGYELE